MTDVKNIITEAAARYGVDPDLALRIAFIESKLDPAVTNKLGSGAAGLFQFMPKTWEQYGQGKNRFDAYANADAGMRFTLDNINTLRKKLGREPSGGEIYLAHQQGAGGALNLLMNPTATATSRVGTKAVTMNGGHEGMNAAEFAGLWTAKLDGTKVPDQPMVYGGAAPASMGDMANSDYLISNEGALSYGEIAGTAGVTDAERREEQKRADENAYGFVEGAGAAAWNEMSIFAPFRGLDDYDVDPGFTVTEENLRTFGEGIPDQFLDEFEGAVSESHMKAIRGRLQEQLVTNQKLADMGMTGTALSMTAAMLDPGAIAAGLAIGAVTGGTGLVAAATARLGRVGLVGITALEAAAGNVITDAALIAVDPTRDGSDLKWSVGAGLMLGGAYGFIRSKPQFTEEADALANLGQTIQREALDEVVSANGGSTIGARQVASVPGLNATALQDTAVASQMAQDVKAVFEGVRVDVTAQFLKSKNPLMKLVGRHFFEDAVRAQAGQVTDIGASEVMMQLNKKALHNFSPAYVTAYKTFLKDTKTGFFQRPAAYKKFRDQVSDFIVNPDLGAKAQYPASVKQAGEAFNRVMKDWERQAMDSGLMSNRGPASNYLPRFVNRAKAGELLDELGYEGISEFYSGAIRKAQLGIDPNLAKDIGKAFAERIHKLRAGSDFSQAKPISFDPEDLKEILEDAGTMSSSEIDDILNRLRQTIPVDEGAGSPRMKSRVIMDELFEADVQTISGGVKRVKMGDFYVRDPWHLMHSYSRHMGGQIALSNIRINDPVTGETLVGGIKNADDWAKFKTRVKGVGDQTGASWKEDEANLDFFYSYMTGVPYRGIDESGPGHKLMRLIRDWNFARLMGQVGFAQVPEAARIVSSMGYKTTLEAMPALRNVLKLAREGKSGDGLLDDMAEITAAGSEWVRGAIHLDVDDFDVPLSGAVGQGWMAKGLDGAMDKALPVSHHISRFVAVSSFMTPINAMLQATTAKAIAIRFGKMSKGLEMMPDHRLKSLGLTPEKMNAIMKEMGKATYDQSGKLTRMNFDQWDRTTKSHFDQMVFRLSREIILEGDPGQFSKWMSNPFFKPFLQFRSFAINAYTKATLQGLNHRDITAGMMFLSSSVVGALVYSGQTWMNAQGDPNKVKYLDDKLSAQKIILGGLQRSSEFSILPMAIDTPLKFTTGETLFDGRMTGQSSDAFMGAPAIDLFNNLSTATSGVLTALAGDDYSSQDFDALRKILPLQRTVGIMQFLNVIGSDLDREKRSY